MKRRSGLGIALGVFASIAFAGSTLAAFVAPTNPGFETGTYANPPSGFQQLNAGDTSIDGWTVDAGSIDWIGTYWPADEGSMSIDMSGAEAGAISQAFETTIGNTYTVSFSLSGNPAGPPTIKTLDVSATGGTPATYTYDVAASANDLTDMKWTTATYEFLATTANTTLSFVSTTASAFGPAIDNVVVTEIAATKDDCKNGGWETMLDTSGNSFKNQGDCVSFFATKGKNLGALPPVAAGDVGAASDSKASSAAKQAAKQEAKATSRTEKAAAKSDGKNKSKSHGDKSHGSKAHKSK